MENFAKNDFYFQVTIFVIISMIVLIAFIVGNEKMIWLFYFGVGVSQSVSYLIRCSYEYKKSLLFKIYGFFIIPIYLSLIGMIIFAEMQFMSFLIVIPMLALYYSPFMALIFVYDNYKTYKSLKINK
ncbi:hypothetical protein ATE47_09575 [Chryseobacterium sp. IHB B 17019]|uniref:hypothetical protein n=1 Tax=Chryseobacterium sp. IHB B 17019 TaxID=1721091 RepID=UPI00071ED248|nr:hypothetical protein [Chryseobacterium sp. IHB B 17019]ALR30761.1 hypothetical protein ATE47_09575 [Chryseobacterium sp. IHB B 17019]